MKLPTTMLAACLASASLAQAAPEFDLMLLSNDYGSAATIGDTGDSRENYAAKVATGAEIAAEFTRLCLATRGDKTAHAAAAANSAWGLRPASVVLEADGKTPEARFDIFFSNEARTSIWSGDAAALKGRPYANRSRGAVITGPVSPKRFTGLRCNLDLKASGLTSGDELAAGLATAIGQPASKLVLKPGFADGFWFIGAGATRQRVAFDIVDLKKSQQLVHLVVQAAPDTKKK